MDCCSCSLFRKLLEGGGTNPLRSVFEPHGNVCQSSIPTRSLTSKRFECTLVHADLRTLLPATPPFKHCSPCPRGAGLHCGCGVAGNALSPVSRREFTTFAICDDFSRLLRRASCSCRRSSGKRQSCLQACPSSACSQRRGRHFD